MATLPAERTGLAQPGRTLTVRSRGLDDRFDPVIDELGAIGRRSPSGGEIDLCVLRPDGTAFSARLGRTDAGDGTDLVAVCGSAFKPIAAVCLLRELRSRSLDLDAPITTYSDGLRDRSTTARHILSHAAGLPHVRALAPRVTDLADSRRISGGLRTLEPLWPPGSRTAYHAVTFGHLAEMVCEDVTGERIADTLRRNVLAPAGIEPSEVGLLGLDPQRVTPLTVTGSPAIPWRPDGRALIYRTVYPLPELVEFLNSAGGQSAKLLSCGVAITAEALAKFYATVVGWSAPNGPIGELLEKHHRPKFDQVMGQRLTWTCGMLEGAGVRELADRGGVLGLPGFGGSMGFCDRRTGTAVGIVATNLDASRVVGAETGAICAAIVRALDAN